MQLTPEIKAQLAEQKKQCIFCKLISGEMPAKKVFEDDLTVVMIDIYPAKKGHITFMPKEHYPIMPYIPANEFKHFFGLIPQLSKALKKAMVTTGINVFVANGGAAGQQSPHFLIHLIPREEEDGFFNFYFKKGESTKEEQAKLLANNLPIMMQNHFGRNPASWHKGKGEPLKELEGEIIYEDEKVVCILPKLSVASGHIEIYSKVEESNIDKLSQQDSDHLFFTASFAATAVFEGLGAHATNIILKSGKTDDNSEGKLCLHIIPRMQDDDLKGLLWEPKQPSYDLDGVAKKVKDKTWDVKFEEEKEEVVPEVIEKAEESTTSSEDGNEIQKAIEEIKK